MSEFKAFSDIERLASPVTITEKIHGTNAQILIEDVFLFNNGERMPWSGGPWNPEYGKIETVVTAGSRTRWLTPGKLTDNYGFATWVEANKEALIKALGPGRHYGEWYGSGINSGYNLKHVFEAEESAWQGAKKDKVLKPVAPVDREKVAALLQPIRLEKLLSRDESYVRDYPSSLAALARAYVGDLEKEAQFEGVDEAVVKAVKGQVFPWIKAVLKEKGLAA